MQRSLLRLSSAAPAARLGSRALSAYAGHERIHAGPWTRFTQTMDRLSYGYLCVCFTMTRIVRARVRVRGGPRCRARCADLFLPPRSPAPHLRVRGPVAADVRPRHHHSPPPPLAPHPPRRLEDMFRGLMLTTEVMFKPKPTISETSRRAPPPTRGKQEPSPPLPLPHLPLLVRLPI